MSDYDDLSLEELCLFVGWSADFSNKLCTRQAAIMGSSGSAWTILISHAVEDGNGNFLNYQGLADKLVVLMTCNGDNKILDSEDKQVRLDHLFLSYLK